MSYSFMITADTKVDVTGKIREHLDAIAATQLAHKVDKETVMVAAENLVRLLEDPKQGEEIYLMIYGSLTWGREAGEGPCEFKSVSATINASLRPKA